MAMTRAAHSRKVAAKRYHCTSSQAFEEMERTLRTVALAAEITMASTTSQATAAPILMDSASTARLNPSNADSPGLIMSALPGRDARRP